MIKVLVSIAVLLVASTAAVFVAADNSAQHNTVKILIDSISVVRDEFPSQLFGFNINHYAFEDDFVDANGDIPKRVSDDLKSLEGIRYRYPGGLVANRFWWESAVDSEDGEPRTSQKKVRHESAGPVRFGVNEYLDFVEVVGGKPWYVLNLVGWDRKEMIKELPADEMAASNAKLAALLRERAVDDSPRYYQLGNELDRAEYQWPVEKYIKRSQLTMNAIREVDPDAKFVAFLRDFDWTYKGAERLRGKSKFTDLIPEVLQGLPSVNDFSLHFYYDDPDTKQKIKTIERRMQQFQLAIKAARDSRDGVMPNIWITEHARGVDLPRGRAMDRADRTGNLYGTISTADFLIAISQVPEIKGAFLHGLNAGPWQVFDASIRHHDLRPRPVYWGMRILRAVDYELTLATDTQQGEATSGYLGGYDVRAAGFSNAERSELGLWVANRAQQVVAAEVQFAPLAGRAVLVQHNHISLPEGGDAEDPKLDPELVTEAQGVCHRFSDQGVLALQLPAGSVSGIKITPAHDDRC